MIGQRGTALLMTMILITVIGSIAFGVGRTTLSNLRQVNRLEDSLNAYQAAQAGIEDALLRFRFDKNAEAPSAAQIAEVAQSGRCLSPTEVTTWYSRVDISDTNKNSCVDLSAPITISSDPGDIVYDLKMSYKKDAGKDECVSVLSPPSSAVPLPAGCLSLQASSEAALKSDTALEYDVRHIIPSSDLHVRAVFVSPNINNALEIISLGTINGIPDQVLNQILLRPSIGGDIVSSDSVSNAFPIGVERIRLRAFGSNLAMYDLNSPGHSLDGRFTTVESIGYFGVAKRKLTLTLDRLTGTVSEVFDFVLFSGSGPIIGPGN